MFVVTSSGRKLPVDDSTIDYDKDWVPFHQTVGLYTDDTVVNKIYIVQLQKRVDRLSPSSGLEIVKEVTFEEYPSQEQILWAMSANGLSRWDVATVIEGYQLDMGGED